MTKPKDPKKQAIKETREMLEQSGSGPSILDKTPEPPRPQDEPTRTDGPDMSSVQPGLPIVRENLHPVPATGPAPKRDEENQGE